jgi:hypothetical protein
LRPVSEVVKVKCRPDAVRASEVAGNSDLSGTRILLIKKYKGFAKKERKKG